MEHDAVAQHEAPAWRDRADFIIGAPLDETGKWEQLWARQLKPDLFELCCIPFFTYGMALGDEVRTETRDGHDHLVAEVVRASGRFAMRVWFTDLSIVERVAEHLTAVGCLLEWRGHLAAVDVVDDEKTHTVSDFLRPYEEAAQLNFETGWR